MKVIISCKNCINLCKYCDDYFGCMNYSNYESESQSEYSGVECFWDML